MTKKELFSILEQNSTDEIVFKGACHDCGTETSVLVFVSENELSVKGGSVYKVPPPSLRDDNIFVKCEQCFEREKELKNWRKTEVYSRVVGYLRPVEQWNKGKQDEWKIRKNFRINQ